MNSIYLHLVSLNWVFFIPGESTSSSTASPTSLVKRCKLCPGARLQMDNYDRTGLEPPQELLRDIQYLKDKKRQLEDDLYHIGDGCFPEL